MVFQNRLLILAAALSLLMAACGPKPMAPRAELDTPGHHVNNGHKLLQAGKLAAAGKEFQRALELDPEYSPGFVGLGLVTAEQGDVEAGLEAIKAALKHAQDDDQKYAAWIGSMRIYTASRQEAGPDWLKRTEQIHRRAVRTFEDRPDAYYFMGLGYKHAYAFGPAVAEFRKVLDIDRAYVEQADREYALVQKIQRAMPGSEVGKKVALVERITRADVAALFIEELKIDELYAKRAPRVFDTSFKSPQKEFVSGEYVKSPPAGDIDGHVLKADIDAVVAMGIRGLQPGPDHKFEPDKTITRAAYAMMIEDILIKMTRDDGLATRFVGSVSPFPDLRNDLPYFNAAMVCVNGGIMAVKDPVTREFDPLGSVSGADALLGLRTLKTRLDKY